MALRPAQMTLRLADAIDSKTRRWCDGALVPFLGLELRICLDASVAVAAQHGDQLRLALPPQASPRQIQDSCEAWQRQEAEQYFRVRLEALMRQHYPHLGSPPALRLSFANRSHWTECDAESGIRCNWRLIQQDKTSIEQVLHRALTEYVGKAAVRAESHHDLFAAF